MTFLANSRVAKWTLAVVLTCAFLIKASAEADEVINIPDIKIVNQNGERLDFYSDLIRDKVVVVNFIFTRCGMVCPVLGYKFGQLQKSLGPRAGNDVHLISISTDATYDTPARLKAWSKPFHKGDGWTQVTGEKQEIDHLLKTLKAFTADKQDHSTLVLIGNDRTGEWVWLDGMSEPQVIVSAIAKLNSSEP